jgi:hypothetical protein
MHNADIALNNDLGSICLMGFLLLLPLDGEGVEESLGAATTSSAAFRSTMLATICWQWVIFLLFCFIILLGVNLIKLGNPYCGLSTNDQQPMTTEDLQYSHDRAWWCQHPTNNMFEEWQNLAPFGGRPIGGTIEALLTKVVNQ